MAWNDTPPSQEELGTPAATAWDAEPPSQNELGTYKPAVDISKMADINKQYQEMLASKAKEAAVPAEITEAQKATMTKYFQNLADLTNPMMVGQGGLTPESVQTPAGAYKLQQLAQEQQAQMRSDLYGKSELEKRAWQPNTLEYWANPDVSWGSKILTTTTGGLSVMPYQELNPMDFPSVEAYNKARTGQAVAELISNPMMYLPAGWSGLPNNYEAKIAKIIETAPSDISTKELVKQVADNWKKTGETPAHIDEIISPHVQEDIKNVIEPPKEQNLVNNYRPVTESLPEEILQEYPEIKEWKDKDRQAQFIQAHLAPKEDVVLGFTNAQSRVDDRGTARHIELQNAIKYAEKNDLPVNYSEIDFRNVGGLNKYFGQTGANKHLRAMSDIIKDEVKKYGGKAMLFRHGGDEASIVSLGAPQKDIEKALDNAYNRITKYVQENNLADIKHGKGGRAGTGIYHATTNAIGADYKKVISATDKLLEKKKIEDLPTLEEEKNRLIETHPAYKKFTDEELNAIIMEKRPELFAKKEEEVHGAGKDIETGAGTIPVREPGVSPEVGAGTPEGFSGIGKAEKSIPGTQEKQITGYDGNPLSPEALKDILNNEVGGVRIDTMPEERIKQFAAAVRPELWELKSQHAAEIAQIENEIAHYKSTGEAIKQHNAEIRLKEEKAKLTNVEKQIQSEVSDPKMLANLQNRTQVQEVTNAMGIASNGFTKAWEKAATPMNTLIYNISPTLWGHINKIEKKEMELLHNYFSSAQSWVKHLDDLRKKDAKVYDDYSRALLIDDEKYAKEAENIAKQHGFYEQHKMRKAILDDLYNLMVEHFGIENMPAKRDFYHPRFLKSGVYDKFMDEFRNAQKQYINSEMPDWDIRKELGLADNTPVTQIHKDALAAKWDEKNSIDKIIAEKEIEKGEKLSDDEKADLISSWMRGYASDTKITHGMPAMAKHRVFEMIPDSVRKRYYMGVEEAMVRYIHTTIESVIRKRFFQDTIMRGTSTKVLPNADLDSSIGTMIGRLQTHGELSDKEYMRMNSLLNRVTAQDKYAGAVTEDVIRKWDGKTPNDSIKIIRNILGEPEFKELKMLIQAKGAPKTDEQLKKIRDLIKARFNQVPMHPLLKTIRNMGYLLTMNSPLSALTQIKDLGISAYKHGLFNTLGAIGDIIKKDKAIMSLNDVHMEHMINEFLHQDAGNLTKHVNWLFNANGITAMDRLGKKVYIASAQKKFKDLANKGDKDFIRDIHAFFPDGDPDKILDMFKKGANTDETQMMMFHEITKYYPATKFSVPEAYLKYPNGRIWYTLKMFTVKQLNFFYQDIMGEYAKGNYASASKKLVKACLLIGAIGGSVDMVKDFIAGKITNSDAWSQWLEKSAWNLPGIFGINSYSASHFPQDPWGSTTKFFAPAGMGGTMADVVKALSGKPEVLLNELPFAGKLAKGWLD